MKFTFLYFVGVLNLLLGYGVTKWLLKEQEDVSVEADRLPDEVEVALRESDADTSDCETIEASSDAPPVAEPTTLDNLPKEASEKLPKEPVENPTSLETQGAAHDVDKTDSEGGASGPDAALEQLENELSGQNAYLQLQLNVLNAKEVAADELEHLSQEIDVAMQRVLKTVNQAIDAVSNFKDAIQNGGHVADKLEDYWSDLNGDAIQLITLVHTDENRAATQEQLLNVVSRLKSTCIEAQEMLMNRPK